ncbi:MAG: lipid-binding SYLF domain-containing protein [Deltaproteobacteria bacterium]|nr:lipid-binding SYLF domain-containing protein [Deltaproteobacteria bacterium]
MKQKKVRSFMVRMLVVVAASFLVWGVVAFSPSNVLANDKREAEQLVETSRYTFENFTSGMDAKPFRDLLKKARGIFICPQMLRGAFVIGASGGTGIFVAKEPQTDTWLGPAFYTIGEVSFGFQAGGDASEIIMLAMTERGANAMLSSGVKLGADVSVAVGPVGAGADASTANFSVDILTFARSKGLYGGVSLKGAVIKIREGLNNAYYGQTASPTDILVRKNVNNPQAKGLLGTVAKYAGGK